MGGTGEHHAVPNQPDSKLQVLPAFLLYGIWEEEETLDSLEAETIRNDSVLSILALYFCGHRMF